MALITLRDISLAFGGPPLFDGITLQIEPGERLCLMGRNGTGKSTLLKLIAGALPPESGEVIRQQGLRVALVSQEIPQGVSGTVFDVVAQHPHANLNSEQWEHEQQVERVLNRLQLDGEAEFNSLSGGTKRRVLLAQALVSNPDILLLDEPTNHLDIDTILWLEDFLARNIATCIFVTHDRAFARRLANRIAELDRGRIYAFSCSYDQFVERREALLEAEITRMALFDKKLAQEEAWVRQGIKARRTRNEGRVRALKTLREESRQRRTRQGTATIRLQEADRSGRLVIEMDKVTFGYTDRPVISNCSTTIMRGDKLGIIGPNGCGKSTLLRLLLGELQPQSGSIRQGTKLEILYMDQLREQLDPQKSVLENVGEGNDTLVINGKPRHIIGYLQDFLFAPERARSPVSILSGGERNRLLLAKLFTKPGNVLVLDEPTNDLDAETLDLLEYLLVDYSGTLLVVSHDREFLNNVVSSTLSIEADGTVREAVGGYDDWLRQKEAEASVVSEPIRQIQEKAKSQKERPRKLSFKEERELEALPERITTLEAEQEQIHVTLADPEFYKNAGSEVVNLNARLEKLDAELLSVYARWEELEALR
jgi:ATP-binding cassette subfamily F protein uup